MVENKILGLKSVVSKALSRSILSVFQTEDVSFYFIKFFNSNRKQPHSKKTIKSEKLNIKLLASILPDHHTYGNAIKK